MFGRLILETYVQDRCRDVRFKDEHLTWFEIKKNDAKRIVKRMGWESLADFLNNYTCLCDHSLAEDEAYVDTNNCPWAVALLEENGFAERTGRTRRSGYCEYPAMKFDRSKMAEFEEES